MQTVKSKQIFIKGLKISIKYYLMTRVILLLIGYFTATLLGYRHLAYQAPGFYSKHVLLDIWGQWDSGWFHTIAKNGYLFFKGLGGQSDYAFFPIYPYLVKTLSSLVRIDHFITGLIISNVLLVINGGLLFLLTSQLYKSNLAKATVKFMYLFPVGFIFSGFLTESLYLFFILIIFIFAANRRFVAAGLTGIFSSLTRFVGITVAPSLAVEAYLNQKNLGKRTKNILTSLFLPVLGTLLYFTFLKIKTGNFWAYFNIVKNGWQQSPTTLLNIFLLTDINYKFELIFGIIVLGLIIIFRKNLRVSHFVFALLSILIPLLSGTPQGLPRYSLPIFPLYIILAKMSQKKEDIVWIIAMLQGFLMVFWVYGSYLVV